MSFPIVCPGCSASLKLKSEPVAGKRLRCPKCEHQFAIPAQEAEPDDDEWLDEDDSEEFGPPIRRRPQASQTKTSGGISKTFIGVIVGGAAIGVIVIVAVLVMVLWRIRASNDAKNNSVPPITAAPTVNPGLAITDAECQEFAENLEKAVLTANTAEFNRLVNFPSILDKCMAGIDVSPEFRNGFRQGAMKSVGSLSNQIVAATTTGGSYQHLRTVESNGIKQVVFRLDSDSGLNYHRFDMTRDASGGVVSGDMYVFLSGEYLSTTFRRMYLPVAANESRGLLERLTGSDHAFVSNMPDFLKMQQALQAGRHQEVLMIFDAFPDVLRREKFMLLARLKSAAQVSSDEYLSTLEQFRQHHSDDVCVDFLLVDYYALKQDYPNSQSAIDRVDQAVGGDPFLNTTRSSYLIMEGKLDDARTAIRPLLNDPRLAKDGHKSMLDIVVAEQDHAATLATLRTLRDNYGFQFGDLSTVPVFANFVKSPEHRQWAAE